jgi:hypothetical protein
MTNQKDADQVLREQQRGLSKFVGARLTSVQFVLDYLILGFDEMGALTTLVWPIVVKTNTRLTFGMDQYRNELCSLISEKIAAATIGPDETVGIKFDKGPELQIPLSSYQGRGERAILTAPNHYLLVF